MRALLPTLAVSLLCLATACDSKPAPSPAATITPEGKTPQGQAASAKPAPADTVAPKAEADAKTAEPSGDDAKDAKKADDGDATGASKTAKASDTKAADDKKADDAKAADDKNADDKKAEDKKAEDKTADDKTADDKKAEPVKVAEAVPTEKAGKYFGDKVVESPYAAWLQSAGRYTVGKPGTVQAVVIAKGSYKCNPDYPFKFKLGSAPAGVSYPAPIARGVSKSPSRTVVSVPFTPSSAGKKTISGKYYLSVCNDQTCKTVRANVSVSVTVHDK